MFEELGISAGRRAWVVLGAIVLAVTVRAQAGEARKPPRDSGAKTPKALCRVKITDVDGLPLAPMGLIAFEDGIYRLRTEAGREIEIAEKSVSAVAFKPFAKPRHDKRGPYVAKDRRAASDRPRVDSGWPPRGPDRRDSSFGRRMKEDHEKLFRLKRSGGLGREIEGLKMRLRKVATGLEAATLIRRIIAAKSLEDGVVPSEQTLRALLATIEKPDVRERMKHFPAKYFRQLGGPRGPRR